MKILVTGGAGYIGSHTVLTLLNNNFQVIVLDNCSNSSSESLNRVKKLSGKEFTTYFGDIRDGLLLKKIFTEHDIEVVAHFAGLKSVAESVSNPIIYYDNNIVGSLNLIKAMKEANVKKIVFSSSATVYGLESITPYLETMPRGTASSPYGASKSIVERVLEDVCLSDPDWSIVNLRYFNPIGAHESGCIGEDSLGVPNNLMPLLSQVAIGKRKQLYIFGDDYPTPDGTCRRDYLHVMDLAEGHFKALSFLKNKGCHFFNLGTGNPYSVLEMVTSFEHITGVSIPYQIVDRRSGDLAEFWASVAKAENSLNWKATRSLDQMMSDTWRWQSFNPNGYR